MVTAGYEAAVAPLGTALTEDQLALLWKMADEPVLCFDGDGAGRRAAYRAVDLALPHIKPGKTLRFALLPEGQDPDDLVRSGGREAISEVIGAARPLADMLWQRETEAGGFDTPERRAGARPARRRGDQRDRRSVGAQILPPGPRRARRHLFAPPVRGRQARRARWEGRFAATARWQGRAGRRAGRAPRERARPRRARGSRRARSCAARAARCRRARR